MGEDIRRKCNSLVDLTKFTSNKNIYIYMCVCVCVERERERNCSLSLQSSLLPNFIQHLIMLGLKIFMVITIFILKIKKNH